METTVVKIVRGREVLISKEDETLFNGRPWHFDHKGYLVNSTYDKNLVTGRISTARFHRLVMEAQSGQIIDHANGNKLDNRRSNLRLATNSQNAANMKKGKRSKTGFKGVDFVPAFYKARIRVNGRLIRLGNFDTAEEAALAYNEAAKLHFGEYASLNQL